MFAFALECSGRTARRPFACRRDQRSEVRRRAVARVFERRLGARHADQRAGRVLDQPRGRAVHARAAARRRRPAGHGGERGFGPGPVALAGPFRDARLRRQQGGRPGADPGRGGAVCSGPDPVQLARPGSDRHADGRPGRRTTLGSGLTSRPSSRWPAVPDRPTTWPRPRSISASRPRGSSPAPSWSSTAAGAFPKASGRARLRPSRRIPHERSTRRFRPVSGRRPRRDRRHRGDAVARDPRRRPLISRPRSSRAGWSMSSAPAIRGWPSRRCSPAMARSRASIRSSSCR